MERKKRFRQARRKPSAMARKPEIQLRSRLQRSPLPQDESLLRSGSWEGKEYALKGAAEVAGGASYPPWDRRFDPYRVPRIQTDALGSQSQGMFRYFEEYPGERFVSDGDPDTIAFPKNANLQPDPQVLEATNKTVLKY